MTARTGRQEGATPDYKVGDYVSYTHYDLGQYEVNATTRVGTVAEVDGKGVYIRNSAEGIDYVLNHQVRRKLQ